MGFEFIIKLLVLIILVFFFVARSRFTTHYRKRTPRTLIKYLIAIVLMALYFGTFFDFAMIPLEYALRVTLGLPLILLGLALFFWAHAHLGRNWSPVIEQKFSKSRTLITTGPYRYVRHPIYTASFIVLAGLFVFTANWILTGIPFVILVLFYARKIPREEAELVRNFGRRYIGYKKETGCLVPCLF